MRRTILLVAATALLIAGGLVATVAILNATLYSPAGAVTAYLEAIQRKDAAGALQLAGSLPAREGSTELLTRAAMPELDNVTIESDTAGADGTREVTASWTSSGERGETTFALRPAGALLGLFPQWEFARSPLGWVDLTVLHDDRFSVNGLELTTPAQNAVASYVVFGPGAYTVTHDTALLQAEAVTVVIEDPTVDAGATLDIQPGPAFFAAAQKAVDASLDDCATQEVLMPTGCPFGQSMANRVASTPSWSIVSYPEVAIVPGLQAGDWQVPVTTGTAHLLVDVRSLFDGSVSTFDEDVPFRVGYLVSLLPGDELALSPQYE